MKLFNLINVIKIGHLNIIDYDYNENFKITIGLFNLFEFEYQHNIELEISYKKA
jgi:hypothetical protein